MLNSIARFIESKSSSLIAKNQRNVVVFHCDENTENLNAFINKLWHRRKLVISDDLEKALSAAQASTKLGEEYDLVVFDMRYSFLPDALGVVSGVLCGGGSLIVLLPDYKVWSQSQSVYNRYIDKCLFNRPGVYYFKEQVLAIDVISSSEKNQQINQPNFNGYSPPYKTPDQQSAVESIVNSIHNNAEYCCVLTSGRGRGKSSSLGLIAANLINQGEYKLLISAPRLSVSDPVFSHLYDQCQQGEAQRGKFKYKNSSLHFIAPDSLLETLPAADVLFIDEAAVIPLSMLETLLEHYSKIIFSTTTHGYEGTGRGFVLKFYKLLDKAKPGWKKIELHQPVRWSENDPLEAWIESVLFLNIKVNSSPVVADDLSSCECIELDRNKLINDSAKLTSIFSLLVSAHYRTSPADFQYLLDDTAVRIYSLEYKKHCLAVLVVNQEGGFDAALSTAVYRGERRPRGHLLAQTLCFHSGYESAAEFEYARVMRIAVHPEIQQQGLGSYLLQQVISIEQARGIDVLGCSFAANVALLNFWDKAGLSLLRVGFSRDHVSASHSAIMAISLTSRVDEMFNELALKFSLNIFLWLKAPLSDLSEDIKKHHLLNGSTDNLSMKNVSVENIKNGSYNMTPFDLADVESFAKYNRNYEACMPAIIRYINSDVLQQKSLLGELSEAQEKMLHLSLRYKHDWKKIVQEMCKISKVMSRSSAIKYLRELLALLLKVNK